jgi:hypothetical protein
MIQPTTPLANATMSHEVNRFIVVSFHAELTCRVCFACISVQICQTRTVFGTSPPPFMDDPGQSPGS